MRRGRPWRRTLVAGLGTAGFAALAQGADPKRVPLYIHSGCTTHVLSAEIAATSKQRRQGLMGRRGLGENEGMLFRYERPQSPQSGFWMFRTQIPLDIAFLDGQGVIVALRSMEPCASASAKECPTYPATVTYRAALEVNRGFFISRDIRGGDVVSLRPGNPHHPCPSEVDG